MWPGTVADTCLALFFSGFSNALWIEGDANIYVQRVLATRFSNEFETL